MQKLAPISTFYKTRRYALTVATSLALFANAYAQPVPLDQLPKDAFTVALDQDTPTSPEITVGKFSNGLRYFIRENKEPADRAELRLVVNAGSILENDKQIGLAHYLEHMAFNGTKHFQKNELVNFMESIGMTFGGDLNASTSFDETIYQLRVPTDDPKNIETALQIMEDWTQDLTLDSNEINLERGVIIEEWRQGQGAQSRIRDKQIPVLLKDSRYASRLPIGTLEKLQNFDHADLRQFYKDWYRPELMAVIAVGDFDKAAVEKIIRQHFENIPASKNPKPREVSTVPAQAGTLFSIISDPEVPNTQVALYHKQTSNDDWTAGGYRQRMVEELYNSMLGTRFQEMARKPDAPFLAAQSALSRIVRSESAYILAAAVAENGINRGLEALLVESERVARFGFSADELERQKTAEARGTEQMYASRQTRSSASYAAEMGRAFLTNESMPGQLWEVALRTRFLPTITLDEVNQVGKNWIKPDNRVVVVTMPQKPGLQVPTPESLQAVIDGAAKVQITPLQDTSNNAPLISSTPKGSPVTQSRELEGGLTEWTLANGIKVIVKPTNFKQDEIVFIGASAGGTSLISDADWIPASTAVSVIAGGGLSDFNTTDLQRKLTGKAANVIPFISDYEEGVRGGGSPADLETMMQLIYLRMTSPRADPAFYQVFKSQVGTALQNRNANPATAFEDTFVKLIYQNNLRKQPPTVEILQQTDLAKSLAIYQDRLGDATDATFVFVGNIDLIKLQPLVETYIGGLPVSGRHETWKDVGIRLTPDKLSETVKRGLEPQSRTRLAFTGEFDVHNQHERAVLAEVVDILQTRLRNVLREQLSGTYGVQVSRQINWQPTPSYMLLINFGSDPLRAAELDIALFAEIEKLKATGPTTEEFNNAQQALLRGYETSTKQNGYWLSVVAESYSSGVHPGASDILTFPDSVKSVTQVEVQQAFSKYLNTEHLVQVTLLPEK